MSNDIANLYSLKCYNYYVYYFLIIEFGHVNGHINVIMYAIVKAACFIQLPYYIFRFNGN
jgi:hypothetical protein